jgi:hypothetical protein
VRGDPVSDLLHAVRLALAQQQLEIRAAREAREAARVALAWRARERDAMAKREVQAARQAARQAAQRVREAALAQRTSEAAQRAQERARAQEHREHLDAHRLALQASRLESSAVAKETRDAVRQANWRIAGRVALRRAPSPWIGALAVTLAAPFVLLTLALRMLGACIGTGAAGRRR